MNEPSEISKGSAGQLVPRLVGGLAVLLGCVVVAGLAFGFSGVRDWFPKVLSVKANAAIAFMLGGGALILLEVPGRRARVALRVGVLVVAALAMLTLMEYASGWDLGIDQLVLRDGGAAAGNPHPGRMAVNSAAGFLLFAGALWLMSGTHWNARRISWLMGLGALVMTTGLVAMLGYLAGIRAGYSWWGPTVMPVYAAVMFILLGAEVMRFAWLKGEMRWWIGLNRTASFAWGLVLLVGVGIYSTRSTTELVEDSEWVQHTHEVIAKLVELRNLMDESQSGMRGFVITGDENFLPLAELTIPGVRKSLAELRDLRELTGDNLAQQARLALLEKLIPERQEVAHAVIEMRRTGGFDPVAQTNAARREKALMDQIRTCLTEMQKEEGRLLNLRDERTEAVIDRTFAILPAGLLLSLLLLGASLMRLNREVGERQHGAEVLTNERNLLRTLMDLLPTLIYVKDRDSRFLVANVACANFMGAATPEELIGKTDAKFYPPAVAAGFLAEELPVFDGTPLVEKEQRSGVAGGFQQVLLTTKVPLRGGDGKIIGLVGVSIDITERQRARQLLWWEKTALEKIGSAAPLPEVLNELLRGLETQLSGGLCSVLLPDEDGIHLRRGAAPSLPEEYNAAVDGLAIGPAAGSCGTAVFLKRPVVVTDIASDPLWANWRELALKHGLRACWSTPILGSGEKILGVFAVYERQPRKSPALDPTLIDTAARVIRIAIERKKAEEEVHKLRTALDEHAIVAITDRHGKITYANDLFCAIAKYSREELIGQDHRIINSGYHPKAFFHNLWQTISHGHIWRGSIKNRAKDGSFYWVNTTIVPFMGQDGKPLQFFAIRNDITEHKHVDAALRLKNLVFDASIAANSIVDPNGILTETNGAFIGLWGYTAKDEVIGQPLADFLNDPNEAADIIKVLDQAGQWDGDFTARRKNGTTFLAHCLATVVHDEDGQVIGYQSAVMDITERKQAEDAIRQLNTTLDQRVRERTSQLESVIRELDAFSYSVSHDLRAPLRAVDGFSRILVEDCAPRLGEDGLRMLGVIRSETQRMGQLIDDLLGFSRLGRQQIEPVPIDMRAMAREVFDQLAALDAERKLRLDLRPLPAAFGTHAMIRQVWVNLIGNAIKFTQARETGEIEIGAQEGDADGAIYYVKDNGSGFDMRYVEKLFGVFQRLHTQQEFPGTGVGLALVKRIVQRHGGRIWAEGRVDQGAIFSFTLPHPPS